MSKNAINKATDTPLMKQYYGVKAKHPDALLLFRVGDFYETFGQDAILSSDILGITLTKRANVELAGFPYHALDTYLPKLVRAGQRVAICDQLEDPKLTKTIVKRGITELVTPGVSFNSNVLEHRENNFLACVHIDKTSIGVAFLDISTGEFFVAEGTANYIDKLLGNFMPKEILFQKGKESLFDEHFGQKYYTYKVDEWFFVADSAREKLLQQFQTTSLKGFGIEQLINGQTAAGAILYYLELTQHNQLSHIMSISRIEEDRYVWLDKFTIRNLELFGSQNENAKSLLNILDKTISPMGARLLRRWIALPLKEIKTVNDRLDVVDYFIKNPEIKEIIRNKIFEIGDIERIISRTSAGKVTPREMVQLKIALQASIPIKNACFNAENEILRQTGDQLNPCTAICEKIEKEIVAEPGQIGKGTVIAEGVNEELDALRNISARSKEVLAEIQQREIETTGISSLKISFNNVFGYYIEVRNTHKNKVPPEWIRKQTLVDAERYITEELKQYEDKILGAEEKILVIEQQIYNDLITALVEYITPVQLNASLISRLDCLLAFAELASTSNYCKPVINNENVIDIKQGRHPVVEKLLPPGEQYIANDLYLDRDNQQIIIITGPNMSGKSAILRQTALIVLLAQIGCFVPAEAATIGIVDKIFTRVGASDNISQGESTFMVEMNEAASILNNLSDRSLILLDEIGRGTSTYDGISIAWALVEYIHEHPTSKAKTLFATHYHELNEMENSFSRIKNYNVTVKELNSKVIFLRKLMKGGVAHSFGIHVARMAGMPKSVVTRAEEILKELEKSHNSLEKPVADIASHREGLQLSFFQLDDPVLKEIRDKLKKIDINNLTPMDALNKLNEIKKITGL
ncbi:MAG: DNA mismatch repair protein MutS [Prevotellaceae bacterium]|jgi:DNA mismatch repair protein MutS|nr:DNA mismatch repair protein MutS [Prevotellaceae bacterium]